MGNTENSTGWLEAALAENLRPVSAPPELWDQVRLPRFEGRRRKARSKSPSMMARLALAAAVGLMLVAGLWSFGRGSQVFGSSELHSGDPLAVRAWVKDRCGLALPLSAQASPAIRLSSVRFQKNAGQEHGSSAELAFEVGGRPALLQVSRAASPAMEQPAHRSVTGDTRSVSWVAGGQLFTLACATPEDLRIACSLCHAGGAL